jgi:uncharacterized protein YbbK (DUF523 family)
MSDDEQQPIRGPTLRLGISTCLLGQRIRYDGGYKRDPVLVST